MSQVNARCVIIKYLYVILGQWYVGQKDKSQTELTCRVIFFFYLYPTKLFAKPKIFNHHILLSDKSSIKWSKVSECFLFNYLSTKHTWCLIIALFRQSVSMWLIQINRNRLYWSFMIIVHCKFYKLQFNIWWMYWWSRDGPKMCLSTSIHITWFSKSSKISLKTFAIVLYVWYRISFARCRHSKIEFRIQIAIPSLCIEIHLHSINWGTSHQPSTMMLLGVEMVKLNDWYFFF